MAGHSHWAGIKHKKALIDNKRGKIWSKLSKAIIVAAQMGGGDVDANNRLRNAVADAKAARMPKDTIVRAIKKGTGELGKSRYEDVVYEGYGVGGTAVMCEIMTDNRNRTAPELRKVFEGNGGKLGATGCVAWMFERKGLFVVSAAGTDEDQIMELALEAGADDVEHEGDSFEISCEPEMYSEVGAALEAAGIEIESQQITRIPSTTVDLDVFDGRRVLKLLEMLDDHDDVQNVSANFNLTEEAMAELADD